MAVTAALVRYDTMCRAIAEAYEVDEVKDIRDKALAFETYSRQARNVEAERLACEIRLRAERKAGQILREMEKAKRGPDKSGAGQRSQRVTSDTPTLADLGVSKRQSSDWQKLAEVPEEQFEAALAAPEKPTTTGIIERHRPPRRAVAPAAEPAAPAESAPSAAAAQPAREKPVDRHALWLWGRLLDFERDGVLTRGQGELLAEMPDHMRDDVLRLAPFVSGWLEGFTR